MNTDTYFKILPIDQIEDHPVGNIVRGPIHNTTDLQAMIKENGLIQPLTVEEDNGRFYLVAGYRRRHALKQLGETYAPCYIRRSDDQFSLRALAAANRFEPQPELILDENDNPIGGLAYVIYLEKDATQAKNYELGESLGVKPDTIGAYLSIIDEFPAMHKRFADGDIAITVYSRIKSQPLEIKEYILRKKGVISIGYVRDVLKNWESIETKLNEEETAVIDSDCDEDEEETAVYEAPTYTNAQCLNEAVQWLGRLDGDLSHPEVYLLNHLSDIVQKIKKEQG